MMNCTVADVTRLPSVRVGDEVVVIGKSGRNEITAAEVAELCDSSPYEVLCTFGQRIDRVYLRNGKRVIAASGQSPARRRLPREILPPQPSDVHSDVPGDVHTP